MQQQGVVPDVITYDALISACEKGQQLEQALKIFEGIQYSCVVSDVITYIIVILASLAT